MYNYYDVVLRPLITEKSSLLSEANKYSFLVLPKSNKELIARAIKHLFNVEVEKVNILNRAGKKVRFKGIQGKRKDYKKAIVTLQSGFKIDFSGGAK